MQPSNISYSTRTPFFRYDICHHLAATTFYTGQTDQPLFKRNRLTETWHAMTTKRLLMKQINIHVCTHAKDNTLCTWQRGTQFIRVYAAIHLLFITVPRLLAVFDQSLEIHFQKKQNLTHIIWKEMCDVTLALTACWESNQGRLKVTGSDSLTYKSVIYFRLGDWLLEGRLPDLGGGGWGNMNPCPSYFK